MNDIAENLKAMERKEILNNHPYKVWQGKDGKWKTFLIDNTKKEGRRQVARATKESVEDAIVEDYKKNHEQRHKIYQLFEDWMEYAKEVNDLSLNSIDRYTNDFNKYIKDTKFAERDIKSI